MDQNVPPHHSDEFISSCITSLTKAPFWTVNTKGQIERLNSDNRLTYLSQVLPLFGFCNLPRGEELLPVQICGNIIREINSDDLKTFLVRVLNKTPRGNEVLVQMSMCHGQYFDDKVLIALPLHEGKLIKDTRHCAYRFYRNGVIKIKADQDQPEFLRYDQINGLVWANQIVNRDFDPACVGKFDENEFLNDITDKSGRQFNKWCQNLCKSQSHNNSWTYDRNRFKALASGFGYLLHRHWSDYKCVIFVDEDLSCGKSNGRTGKSLVLNDALSYALKSQTIDAKVLNKKTASSQQFTFNFVEPSTQYICFDDACQKFDFSFLFSIITGSLTVNRKYGGMFQFPKNEKPKMSITSNHPISGEGSSYSDRQHIVSIGGFYRFHKMEAGKSPDKFHGGFLFDEDWGDHNWKEFDQFCVECLHYYLKHGLINKGTGEKYHLNKLELEVGSTYLVATLHRFLEANVGEEIYTHSVEGMTADQVSRCLCDFVTESIPGETFTQHKLTKSLKRVADHFSYHLNTGNDKSRGQRRFGSARKGVDCYHVTTKDQPFSSSVKDNTSDQQTDEERALAYFMELSND